MPQTLRLPFCLSLIVLSSLLLLPSAAHAEDRVAVRGDRDAFAASTALDCNSPLDPAYYADALFSVAPAGLAPGAVQRWSDPSTWADGRVPRNGDKVVIESNQVVLLDQSTASLENLTVKGILRFEDRPLSLTSGWILIEGNGALLEVGTEAVPFVSNATITLTATNRNRNVAGSGAFKTGNKFIITRDGGSLAMHGASRVKTSWTVLDQHADPGTRSIQVADAVNWDAGDIIVIAPSGYSAFEAETRTIERVDGRTVRLTEPLNYRHFGEIQTIEGRRIDMRAEVGLLSRNILIQGDAASEDGVSSYGYRYGFGGHMMFMAGGVVTIEGVEVTNMGQTGLTGRYALHWHYADYRPSDYVRNSSFHNNFQRAVNIHKSHQVTVENNVAYATTNHAFVFSEDGDEVDNRFVSNLSILNWAVLQEHFAFGRRQTPRLSNQSEERAAHFWGRNPHNQLIDNRAAGSYLGHGFFFDQQFMSSFTTLTRWLHRDQPIVFQGNVAHSIYIQPGTGSFASYGPETRGSGLMIGLREGPYPLEFGPDFLAYKVGHSGVWIEEENETIVGAVVTDSGIGVSPMLGSIRDLFVVGNTDNDIGGPIPATARHLGPVGGVNITDQSQKKAKENDRVVRIDGATFVNVEPAAVTVEWRKLELGSEVSGLNFVNTDPLFFFTKMEYGGIYDVDGTLSGMGKPGTIYGESDSAASISGCDWMGESSAWFCPEDGRTLTANPAFGVENPQPGVQFTLWKGEFIELVDVDTITDALGGPTDTGTADNFNINILPIYSGHTVRFEGFIEAPETGDYRFQLNAKEGGALSINGKTIIWTSRPGQPQVHEGWVRLEAGYHPIAVDHYKKLSNPQLRLSWDGPSFNLREVRDNELVWGTATEPPDDGGGDDDGGGTGGNQSPVVTITKPGDGSSFSSTKRVVFRVDASDPDGEVEDVFFYVNGTLTKQDKSAPWKWGTRLAPGSYTITAEAVDLEGARTMSAPIDITIVEAAQAGLASSSALPTEFAIEDVYPNPFNPATTMTLAMPEAGDYDITIYDVAGRKVQEVLLLDQEAGYTDIPLDLSGHASGLYIIQAHQVASGRMLTERVTLLK
ncbi:MAG: G8 domain-containing protein [Bacteroidota bacterium]